MTAYELRRHLAAEHDVRMVGADYGTLLKVHDIEHRADAGHTHDDQTGHTQPAQLVWLVFLAVFIIVGLRLLGMAL